MNQMNLFHDSGTELPWWVARAHKELEPQAVYFAEGDIADCDFDVWILRALHKQRNFDENILKGL
jgi:hypothetical protein